MSIQRSVNGLTCRRAAESCEVGRPAVAEYEQRARQAGLSSDEVTGLEAAELDSGAWSRIPEQPMQPHAFPSRLVALAARCGVGLRVSVHSASNG